MTDERVCGCFAETCKCSLWVKGGSKVASNIDVRFTPERWGNKDTPSAQARYAAFLQAFEQLGWMDGRNVQIVARWSGGNSVELRKYAEELAALAPDVVLAGGGTGAEAMLKATRTIPIVFAIAPDPVGAGIVAAL